MVLYSASFVICLVQAILVSSQTYIPDNSSKEIACFGGQVINVTNATYGCNNSSICPTIETDPKNCTAFNVTDLISDVCNGVMNCTIGFSENDFDINCANDTRYLAIYYDCVNVTEPKCGKHEFYSPIVCDCLNRCQTPDFSCAPFCSINGGCICKHGYRKDPITGTCVGKEFCPQGGDLLESHEEFSECANSQRTCRHPNGTSQTHCIPGYQCSDGYVRDLLSSYCINEGECLRSFPVPRG